jgi:flagellar hook assembly protein FlgD
MSEDGYIIERADSGGDFAVLDSVGPDVTVYLDGSVSLGSMYSYRVKAFDASNQSLYSDEVVYDPVPVENHKASTGYMKIYPNPAEKVAFVEFQLHEESHVEICIMDMSGKVIRKVADSYFNPGMHTVEWNLTGDGNQVMKPGIYICTLQTRNRFRAQKLTITSY